MTTLGYADFLASKARLAPTRGVPLEREAVSAQLFPFQRDLTWWALRKGCAALFASTGLGKTLMQLEWAQHAAGRVLVLAPLGVARQTVREGEKFGIPVTHARSADASPTTGITITNYEMMEHFDPSDYGAVVLDESSILKSFEGKMRTRLIERFVDTPLKLCCTATPAPNDITEIANHAEFLGVMKRTDMLATFFVHDDQGWRLKKPAREAFYRWLASWAMSITLPSDLGYEDDGYILPELRIKPVIVATDYRPDGVLWPMGLKGITERSNVRKSTVADRVAATVALVNAEPDESWLLWCGRNDEADALAKAIPGSVNVQGSDDPEVKGDRLAGFADGEYPVLISKPSLAGFGLNLQRCARMAFVGLSDSYEQYFQAIRRCWRFGQRRPVDVYIVLSEPERPIYDNVLRKEREAGVMTQELIRHVAEFERVEVREGRARMDYAPAQPMVLPSWL